MEVAGDVGAAEPGETRPLKPCLLRRNHSREQHGVAASSLEELRSKAYDILAIDKSLAVTLVLAEDGTIVDDDDYFLCLPSNTKFVALAGNEKWAYCNSDGGTSWISQESVEVDEPDSGSELQWKNVARQLKEDLSSIILLSEHDLQVSLLPSPQPRSSSPEITLRSQILTALKEKPAPELSLSSQDLELVTKEDPKALAVALNWDIKKTETVQQACNQ
ncbi:PREDICTED: DNA fragmentation factor subunit alpha, partial [Ceratotherium simum simum]|uniref:DNAation factor subunit alpha n=1 Tax=Ceratotherium simum simum TaxID=73337 RepID=A0ABM0HFR7_CERSS